MKINKNDFFIPDLEQPADPEEIAKEKRKAQLMRKSQWWKNKRGRNQCYYCRQNFSAKELTMDHRVPLSRGGKSNKSNLVPCCKECNNQKKFLLPSEWEAYLERLQGSLSTLKQNRSG